MTTIWLMLALVAGALIYLVMVVIKYNAVVQRMQSKIEMLEKKSMRLSQMVEHEKTVTRQKIDLVGDSKTEESDLRQENALTGQKLKTAQAQENSLEMDMYKQEFKKIKQQS